MAQGRGTSALSVVVLLFMVGLYFNMAKATTYKVGDAAGWRFNVANWPVGKSFKAGDILG